MITRRETQKDPRTKPSRKRELLALRVSLGGQGTEARPAGLELNEQGGSRTRRGHGGRQRALEESQGKELGIHSKQDVLEGEGA